MKTIKVSSHVEMDITRPDGTQETVTHPKFKRITPPIFKQIVTATKKAGRGTFTTYRNVEKEVEVSEELDSYSQAVMDSAEVDKMSRMGE